MSGPSELLDAELDAMEDIELEELAARIQRMQRRRADLADRTPPASEHAPNQKEREQKSPRGVPREPLEPRHEPR